MSSTTVVVNVSDLIKQTNGAMPTEQDIALALSNIGTAAMAEWKRLADRTLTSTARDYKAGLRSGVTDSGRTIFLELSGSRVVEQAENGFKGGDMRTWMLKSPKAKTSKDGSKYLVVPFRHGTPGAAKGAGTKARSVNVGNRMPRAVHAAAKKLHGTINNPSGAAGKMGTKWGGRLHEGSKGVNKAAHKEIATRKKPWHAMSIYKGMVRKEQADHSKGGSQTSGYTTFRVISSKVRRGPKHWHHPGITGKFLAKKVSKYIDRIAAQAIVDVVNMKTGGA